MLRQLVVARLEACHHFLVDLEAALARKLEVPGIALLFDLVELRQVRIVAALGARVVRDMGVLHREDRIVERAVSQIVHLEFLLRLGILAILRVDGTAVEDEDEVHHFLGLDRFAEVHQLLHAELLGVATLAVEHLLLVCREFHGHGYPYPLRVIVTVAFWPTFGASISTQSPVLMVAIGSWSKASMAGIPPAMAPLMSISWTFWQMMAAGP